MKYFIVTGESSGDFIASKVVEGLYMHDDKANIQCWGGAHLRKSKATVVKDIRDLSVMGFTDVLLKIRTLLSSYNKVKNQISSFSPDVVVLVDYAGFNMRIARWAKSNGYKTVYIAPPKTWASRESRNTIIKKYVDQVIVMFPFEKDYFQSKGIQAEFYGHPLFEKLKPLFNPESIRVKYHLDNRPINTIAPGSRRQEIKYILPRLCELTKPFPQYNWCISLAPNISKNYILRHIPPEYREDLTIVTEPLTELLSESTFAMISSGTATVEAAIAGTPQVVVYRTGWVNYWIARLLIKTKFISLVNLIMDQIIVSELIQRQLNICNLKDELRQLMEPRFRDRMLLNYDLLSQKMNSSGPFSDAAKAIIKICS
jgi:lipid-A-disaccharide synthase